MSDIPEFLMTYGWAILVAICALGALFYFGVLSPDKFVDDERDHQVEEFEEDSSSFFSSISENADERRCSNNIKDMYESCIRRCPTKFGGSFDGLECPQLCADTILR